MDMATVLYDLETGLKAHMYLVNNQELRKKGWDGQIPPRDMTV